MKFKFDLLLTAHSSRLFNPFLIAFNSLKQLWLSVQFREPFSLIRFGTLEKRSFLICSKSKTLIFAWFDLAITHSIQATKITKYFILEKKFGIFFTFIITNLLGSMFETEWIQFQLEIQLKSNSRTISRKHWYQLDRLLIFLAADNDSNPLPSVIDCRKY